MIDRPSPSDLREVSAYFGLPSERLVEKDWHVVRAMQAVLAVDAGPFELVFAGGTCLARAHRLVQRMSEDVDFKVVPKPGATAPSSKNQLRLALGDLRARITRSLQEAGLVFDPNDPNQLSSRDDNRYTVYNLAYTPEDQVGVQLRPTLQIELNYTVLRQQAVGQSVSSFIAEAFGRPAEIATVPCVSVNETAAEKLVALTRRTAMELSGHAPKSDPTLVRHIYDLHAISAHVDRDAVATMARAIAVSDAEEFRHQHPAYQNDIVGETRRAIAAWTQAGASPLMYDNFVWAMVYGQPVPFATAITTTVELAKAAWPGVV